MNQLPIQISLNITINLKIQQITVYNKQDLNAVAEQ